MSKLKPNYFVAVPLRVSKCQGWLQKSTQGLHPSVRNQHVMDLHITVAFLGKNMPNAVLNSVENYLDSVAELSVPQMYTLERPILLPNSAFPTAVGYEVGLNHDSISTFILSHRLSLMRLLGSDTQTDFRIPRPHVTIARPCKKDEPDYDRSVESLHEWVRQGDSHAPGKEHPLFLEKLALYTWSDEYPNTPQFQQIFTKDLLPPQLRDYVTETDPLEN